MFFCLKIDYFWFWFFYKSDLGVSAVKTMDAILEFNTFNPEKQYYYWSE